MKIINYGLKRYCAIPTILTGITWQRPLDEKQLKLKTAKPTCKEKQKITALWAKTKLEED